MTTLVIIFTVVFVLGIGLIVGDALWKRWRPPARHYGSQPGQGYVLMHSGGSERSGASRQWHVSLDPQEYARSFAPPVQNKD